MKKKRNSIFLAIASTLLLLLIIFNFFEFFHLLSIEIGFILKLISVSLFAYLFYKVSTSHLIFGNKSKQIDIIILISYFLFSIKNLISIINSYLLEIKVTSSFYDFFHFISQNQIIIEYYSFVFGSILLILASAYFCFVKIGKNSLMHLIHEERKLKGKDIFVRFFVSLIVLLAFYIIVFNLAIEYLVLVIHGPLLLILFFVYLFIAVNKKTLKPYKFLYKVGHSVEHVYGQLIRMFHSKRILLGLAGLLTLHLLTDFFVFIIPYLTGHFSSNYLTLIHATPHTPIITLFLQDIALISGFNSIGVVFIYLFNLIAISVILLTPFYLWYKVFEKKKIKLKKWCLALSYTSLFTFIAMPLFSINQLTQSYAGIDILTKSISNHQIINLITLIAITILVLFYYLSKNKTMYRVLNTGMIFFVLTFTFIYLYNFFISISLYYTSAISNFVDIFVKIIMLIFFAINIIFYIFGYAMLVKYILADRLKW
tara:strand:+ start:893 stop:2341 length:1449 start_codon:yes stop_codon:yes gene_type:complete